ncbi:hypothetical protein ACFVWG_24140 [Kribbella sp. NPDC058245]|uniref:hypothetical protein n=1 Tax=Kribbella sp. NPDC058245 TaxID=3346399 RepID=UPI0036E69121
MIPVEVARARDMLERSEKKLLRLQQIQEADPEDPQAWFSVVLEQARNRTLRVVLGHPDEPKCMGIDS